MITDKEIEAQAIKEYSYDTSYEDWKVSNGDATDGYRDAFVTGAKWVKEKEVKGLLILLENEVKMNIYRGPNGWELFCAEHNIKTSEK